jgi:hypothetical protein
MHIERTPTAQTMWCQHPLLKHFVADPMIIDSEGSPTQQGLS